MRLFKKKMVAPKEEPISIFPDIPLYEPPFQESGIEWDLPISTLTGRPYDPELIERLPSRDLVIAFYLDFLGFHTPQE